LWISTNNGISKFNLTKQTFTNYDIEDGLQSNEFNSGAFYSSERGEFFFGGINGFNSFFPDSIKDNPVVPEVAITSCKIFDEEWKGDTSLTLLHSLILPYNQNTLSFAFAPLEFTQPEKNLIKYRLIGLDTHWVSLGEERKVSFIGLSSGKYILQAKACNNDGIWNRIPKQLNIIIVPPLWKRPWFMALFVLLLLSAFGILIRYFSTRKLKRKLEILERHRILEEERTRISRDMHDEIGAGLSKISLLCEISKKKDNLSDDTRMQMEKITTSSRQIVDNMGEIIWSLNPKHDTLYELLSYMRDYIYEYFEALPIKLSLKFPEIDVFSAVTIDARFRRNIFLVVKEALHNIVKHSSATVAIVDIEIVKEKMTILISDNGKGICTDDMPGKYSNGLKNMKQRITEIGGEIKIVSEQNKGTLIRIVCVNQAFDSVTNTTLM
jgi:signal transduction histidine kinase